MAWLQVLSDYIVKNRGILPGSARDAYDQYREVELIVMSTYKACVEADTDGDGLPFTAQVHRQTLPCALSQARLKGVLAAFSARAKDHAWMLSCLCRWALQHLLAKIFLHLDKAAVLVRTALKA